MYSGKVIHRFIDKYTRKRYEVGHVYEYEDEKRLIELSEKGFVEYKKKPSKKAKK